MSRILHHVGVKDFKKVHQRKLGEQKEVLSEKIKVEEEKKKIEEAAKPFKSNWRNELSEGMTTAGLGMINLSADDDVDIVDTETSFSTLSNSNNATVSGGEIVMSGDSNSIAGGTHTIYRRAILNVDATRSSTLKLTIQKGGGTSSWTDRGGTSNFDDNVSLNIYSNSNPLGSSYYDGNVSSGTHIITLPSNYSDLVIQIEQFAKVGETGSLRITNASLQRRTPVNVIVGLDNPEATNFIRTNPVMRGLSAQDRRKKLEDMLDAGDQYLLKQVGLQGSIARPADTGNIQSWQQNVSSRSRSFGKRQSISSTGISQQLYKNDLKAAGYSDKQIAQKTNVRYIAAKKDTETAKAKYDALKAKASTSKTPVDLTQAKQDFESASAREFDIMMGRQSANKNGYMNIQVGDQKSSPTSQPQPTSKQSANTDTQIAGLLPIDPTPPIKGPSGYKKPGTYDPNQFYPISPNDGPQFPSPNLPKTGPGLSKSGQDTQIAKNITVPTYPGSGFRGKYDMFGREIDPKTGKPVHAPMSPPVKQANKKNKVQIAHYEPQGQVLSEKKLRSPKDVMSKIPGYYDGKPAPFGFPVEPPPEMVNGFHPDLVDGKKVADRFNRLDPQSAQAMPSTGNPHIDKKVRAAAKKPK